MDGVVKLIKETYVQNEIMEQIPTETETEVFAEINSVTRSEWAEAGRAGLNPSAMIRTPRVNYSGEKIVEWEGVRYGVYRTYAPPDSDFIEIYLEEKVGI